MTGVFFEKKVNIHALSFAMNRSNTKKDDKHDNIFIYLKISKFVKLNFLIILNLTHKKNGLI